LAEKRPGEIGATDNQRSIIGASMLFAWDTNPGTASVPRFSTEKKSPLVRRASFEQHGFAGSQPNEV
jgi:hypothetical protein